MILAKIFTYTVIDSNEYFLVLLYKLSPGIHKIMQSIVIFSVKKMG